METNNAVLDPDNVWHVLPTSDIKEHCSKCTFPPSGNPYCACECEPTYKFEDDGMIVVHNSFDGREGIEMANEILSQPVKLCYKTNKPCRYDCGGLCKDSC